MPDAVTYYCTPYIRTEGGCPQYSLAKSATALSNEEEYCRRRVSKYKIARQANVCLVGQQTAQYARMIGFRRKKGNRLTKRYVHVYTADVGDQFRRGFLLFVFVSTNAIRFLFLPKTDF